MAATGVSTTHYPCESCGHQQAVTIADRDDGAPVSLNRRACDRCAGALSSFPVGFLDTIERLSQEHGQP